MSESQIMLSTDIEPPQGCATVIGWLLVALALTTGCVWFVSKPRQITVESKAASQIINWMRLHAAMQPGLPVTNLSQVYNYGYGGSYSYDWHLRFRAFGKCAGFDNALSEKYVWFPPGTKADGKDLVFMNAKPFPYGRTMGRIVVFGTGGNLDYREYPEQFLKGWLEANRVVVPPVAVATLPPAPAEWRYGREGFWLSSKMTLAKLEWRGFSERSIRLIEKAAIIGLAVVTGALAWLCFRRPRRTAVAKASAHATPFLERASTKNLLAWAAVFNLALFLFAGCALTGRDRIEDEVIAHLLAPYFAISQHGAKLPGLVYFLLVFGQFPAYTLVLLLARKDWRIPVAHGLAVMHTLAVIGSVFVAIR